MARRGDGKNYLPYAFHESQKARIRKSMKKLSRKEQARFDEKYGDEQKKRFLMGMFWTEYLEMLNKNTDILEGVEWWRNKI